MKMNVTLKNNASRAIIIPGVGDLSTLTGMVIPGKTITVDSKLADTDFVRGMIERGELADTTTEAPVVPVAASTEEDDLIALREQAEGLGIDVDGRWSVKRLLEEIAKV